MSTHKYKRKIWLDDHSRKIQKEKSRIKQLKKQQGQRIYEKNRQRHEQRIQQTVQHQDIKCIAPETFSFRDNCEETAAFFKDVLEKRDGLSIVDTAIINIDFNLVKKLSVDALMFLIAVMYDTRNCNNKHIIFKGNFPKYNEANRIFNTSGFTNYVKTKSAEIQPISNNIQISNGMNSDPKLVGKICKYIHSNSNLTRINTMPLYNLISELMNNTKDHAYGEGYISDYSKNSWYLFSEKRDNKIIFVFLDTGVGIPKTVYKKWHEKIKFVTSDSYLIKTALEGAYRTETGLQNRGRGLPQILDCCQSGLIDNAYVYSGKGYCVINKRNGNVIQAFETKNALFGTLFSWEVKI